MATTSPRSFNNYSGLEQQKLLQTRQSATDLLSDPDDVRSLQNTAPWALGLSQREATPSGRSFYDPGRQAERWVRGTGSREQTQAAMAAQGFKDGADPMEVARRMSFGPKGQGIVGAGKVKSLDPNFKDEQQQRGGNIVGAGQIAAFNVPIPGQQGVMIPQTVADPGMMQPPPQAPNLFNQSMTNPAMAQSQYSIGAALNGGLVAPKNPFKQRIPMGIAPQILL